MEFTQKSTRLPKTAQEKAEWKRVIVILEHCPIASVSSDKGFELLAERHRNTHAKRKQDPAEWRPDVVHQCLLHLLDSPLNRAGMLQVFLRTKGGVVIAVDPRLRVPRCMRIFEKMMVMLLYKMKVRSTTGYLSLLKIVRNPVTDHIPANARLIRVEKDGDLVDIFNYAGTTGKLTSDRRVPVRRVGEKASREEAAASSSSEDEDELGYEPAAESANHVFDALHTRVSTDKAFAPFAFIIGGMARGDVNVDYAERGQVESIRLGDRGLSAAAVCSKILHAYEELWITPS